MSAAPAIACRQWWATLGTMATLVVASTKDDARILARERMVDAGHRPNAAIRIREATERDLEAWAQRTAKLEAVRG